MPPVLSEDASYTGMLGAVGSNQHLDRREDNLVALPSGPQKFDEDADALRYLHPEYSANILKWKKYSDLYSAEDIYKYIFQHTRESDDLFERRVKRGYYYNYVASLVDLMVAYLYHSPVERKPGNLKGSDLEAIYKDANLCGDTYFVFQQLVSTFAFLHGHCGILIDAPQEGYRFKSEDERKRAKHRAYLTLVRADQILDWELDKFGKFEWVKMEICRPQNRSWKTSVDVDTRYFLIWTRDHWEEWSLSGDEARRLGEAEHDLGEVPLVISRNERSLDHKWMGLSVVRDIADINIGILNWASLGDEEIYERCLNVLTMERDDGDAPVALSHNNVLEYSSGTNPPQYLTPGESPLKLIKEWIAGAKDEIYRLAKMGGSTGLLGVREATSGIAYAFEFNETNQSLGKKAESQEQTEIETHRLIAKWYGKEWDGEITYAREFGVEDFLAQFQLLSEARMTLTSDTAIKELENKTLAKMFAREKQDLRARIFEEVQKADARGIGLFENFGTTPAAMTGTSKPKSRDKGSATGSKSEKKKDK